MKRNLYNRRAGWIETLEFTGEPSRTGEMLVWMLEAGEHFSAWLERGTGMPVLHIRQQTGEGIALCPSHHLAWNPVRGFHGVTQADLRADYEQEDRT